VGTVSKPVPPAAPSAARGREQEFDEIADTFRDPRVWTKNERGEWIKDNIWDFDARRAAERAPV